MIRRFLLGALLVSAAAGAAAQSIQLSPSQQQLLNSLPAAQRQQALAAIRDLQQQESLSEPTTINETPPIAAQQAVNDVMLLEDETRAQARSRIVIGFSPRESIAPAQREILNQDPALTRLLGSNVFTLDDTGILSLDGLEKIPLLGLDETDIKKRLEAEPSLDIFDIDVRILSQKPIGIEALEPFGYDLFESGNRSFDAPGTGPVPPDYVLGPGDSVRVQLFGNVNGIYEYEVSRDGILNLPELGPITVAGIPFSEFRAGLNKRVGETLIGTQVSVTMGPLRTIRVFVLGDAKRPGSYIVGGLATVSGALYQSGGISEIGSLRDVQLKRNGRIVSRLDLYDLLIRGDTSGDRRLQPGDVIFVPPIGDTVSVAGAVNRPAIYEIGDGASADDAVNLAGGLANDAFGKGARLERIDEGGERTVLAINLDNSAAAAERLRSGDKLLVPKVLPDVENAVFLNGHVYRPGTYAWRSGLRLTDLIASSEELQPGVDLHYVLVRRQLSRGSDIEALSADLAAALANPSGAENITLQPRDEVHVFSLELGRQRTIVPLVEELRRQATHEKPARQVQVGGYVRAPGIYPLEGGMRVSDLLRAGGSLAEEAYAFEAELTRYAVTDGDTRVVETRDVDLARALNGDLSADIQLQPHDYLLVRRIPKWDTTWTVSLEGEVRFPGAYRIRRGETLAEVLRRAGGLTDYGFPEGAVFLRESLKQREQEQIELLARRLESDLTTLALQTQGSAGPDTQATGNALLEQLRTAEAVGRLVIDPRNLRADATSNGTTPIELRDGDRLLVPKRSQVVTVIGETQQNTSHLFATELSRDDYIDKSGGLTRRADRKRIYIVRANGAVIAGKPSRWLGRGSRIDVRPGDTIVVPLDADKMRPLTFWTNVTQILYQGAIAVAAVRSFN